MSEIICFILAFIAGIIAGNIFAEKLKLEIKTLKYRIKMQRLEIEAYRSSCNEGTEGLAITVNELLPEEEPTPPICSDRAEDDVSLGEVLEDL